ncbi:MAG: glycosyltransferase family 4 protein [Actinomycetota bacterium]|nr:glycosyltransferase family 4 protein [Actinomycetota bacterium]
MSNLRVLTLNHADVRGGGAAIAGYRLHLALTKAGIESSMLVGGKASHDDRVHELRQLRTVRRPIRAVTERLGLNELDGISAYGVQRRQDFRDCDVVHYHAIHGSWFSYPTMPTLTQAKPSALTLHDMWPLTGHCSFSFGCDRWKTGCGTCPHPEVFPAIRRDSTALEWKLKDRLWAHSRLTIVSPSTWLADIARRSMLGRFDIEVIPHGLDTEVFAPRDKVAARAALGLPADEPVMMFAAASVNDRRKGADLVIDAVRALPPSLRDQMIVVIMGDQGPQMKSALIGAGARVADFGFVPSDDLKAVLYSAADVFVFPTRADNSPLVVLESLACGTPVVAFDVGGISDMVRPGQTGSLAAPGDVESLTTELAALVEEPDEARRLGRNARQMAVTEFNEALAVQRHRRLYHRLLGSDEVSP